MNIVVDVLRAEKLCLLKLKINLNELNFLLSCKLNKGI